MDPEEDVGCVDEPALPRRESSGSREAKILLKERHVTVLTDIQLYTHQVFF